MVQHCVGSPEGREIGGTGLRPFGRKEPQRNARCVERGGEHCSLGEAEQVLNRPQRVSRTFLPFLEHPVTDFSEVRVLLDVGADFCCSLRHRFVDAL
jgi:hypothetical protein